ncbi:unnamed protein product [Paramecium pentaurelia]|uniref:Transmembrane protein n=1 Tax=Paramecium pentaurelia TaxID=43138 RepID=A0A8S1YR40_9CILI|nr:unnamed protein product [Paramecium pentaurelia]
MYIILIVSCVAFLFGNLEILWNLLDMLQQLSFMKYHNLQFPENLQIYFEIFTIGSFTPIIDILQTDLFLQNLFDYQIPLIPAKWKFEYYQINCYFLQNLLTLFSVVILGFVYFVISYLFYKFLIIIKYQNWPAIFYNNYPEFFYKVIKFIFQLQKLARKQYQYFIYSGLIRIYTSNFYELTFTSILQIVNLNLDTTFNTIISLLAIITLICNFLLISSVFSYLSKNDRVNKTVSVLIEGIENKINQGTKQYFTILLLKKTLFIVNIVAFQALVAAQSLITAMISGVFSCYIKIYKPFENKYENTKLFITEILIMLNTIVFSIYEIIKSNEDKEQTELLGWINVAGFTLILILTLTIDVYQQIKKYFKLIMIQFNQCFGIQKKNPEQTKMMICNI